MLKTPSIIIFAGNHSKCGRCRCKNCAFLPRQQTAQNKISGAPQARKVPGSSTPGLQWCHLQERRLERDTEFQAQWEERRPIQSREVWHWIQLCVPYYWWVQFVVDVNLVSRGGWWITSEIPTDWFALAGCDHGPGILLILLRCQGVSTVKSHNPHKIYIADGEQAWRTTYKWKWMQLSSEYWPLDPNLFCPFPRLSILSVSTYVE